VDELHRQAVELMRAGKTAKAAQIFDRVYAQFPAERRTRPLVINRAILDLSQRSTIVRGVRDLSDYLVKHRAEDEEATNVLGAALNVAAGNSRVKAGAAWQAASKEWERRNYVLDHSRPGWRRWGTRWVSENETKSREAHADELKRAIADQADYVDRLTDEAYSLGIQQQNALDTASAYGGTRARVGGDIDYRQGIQRQIQEYRRGVEAYRRDAANYEKTSGKTLPRVDLPNVTDPIDPRGLIALQNRGNQLFIKELEAAASAREIGADLAAVYRRLAAAQSQMQQFQTQLQAIRPEWPERFEPVDPSALEPTPTTLPSATTTTTAVERDGVTPAVPSTAPLAVPVARPASPADLYGESSPPARR
jgi:hypothetical protein